MVSVGINATQIGKGHRPYIIAEMSGNHNQSFDQAIKIVKAAKYAGANALKLQTYTADALTIDVRSSDFLITNPDSLWKNETLYDLYKRAFTAPEWIADIFEFCRSLGIDCFSSVFDESAVDFLETLNPCAYKIASFENIHYPLIRKAAQTGRPLIISTGLANEEEIDEAVTTARNSGCKDLILLKCTSDYPADPSDTNLLAIPYLEDKYDCVVGLSDHTLGNQVALASIAVGASVIEKHFTISRDDGGVDSAFSANADELCQLVRDTAIIAKALGTPTFSISERETKSIQFRRSIYAVKDIAPGEKFSPDNVRIIRPGFGLHPRHFVDLMGNKSKRKYSNGDRISDQEI